MLCCTSDTNIAAENPRDENFTNNDQMWNSWYSHLQIFSLSRAIEISRQYTLLHPCWEKNNSGTYICHHRRQWQLVYYLQRPIFMANLNQMNVIGTLRPFNNLIGCEEPLVGRQEGRINVKDEIISMSWTSDKEKMSPRNRAGTLADPSSMQDVCQIWT